MFSAAVSDDGWSVADESALGSLLKSVERLVAFSPELQSGLQYMPEQDMAIANLLGKM